MITINHWYYTIDTSKGITSVDTNCIIIKAQSKATIIEDVVGLI